MKALTDSVSTARTLRELFCAKLTEKAFHLIKFRPPTAINEFSTCWRPDCMHHDSERILSFEEECKHLPLADFDGGDKP